MAGESLWSAVAAFWPILVVGFLVFAIWGLGKRSAKASGYHFGLLGVAVVVLILAVASLGFGSLPLAAGLGLVGALLLLLGFSGSAR